MVDKARLSDIPKELLAIKSAEAGATTIMSAGRRTKKLHNF